MYDPSGRRPPGHDQASAWKRLHEHSLPAPACLGVMAATQNEPHRSSAASVAATRIRAVKGARMQLQTSVYSFRGSNIEQAGSPGPLHAQCAAPPVEPWQPHVWPLPSSAAPHQPPRGRASSLGMAPSPCMEPGSAVVMHGTQSVRGTPRQGFRRSCSRQRTLAGQQTPQSADNSQLQH